MLASLGHAPNRADVAHYFEQSLSELGWEVPELNSLIRHYAQGLAQDIVDGTIAPIEGCHQMYSLYCSLDAPVAMQVWLYLDDQLEQGTYRELEGAEWEAAIHRAAQEFQPIEP